MNMTYTVNWRRTANGDFYEQKFRGYPSLQAVVVEWREFWNLRPEECVEFSVTQEKDEQYVQGRSSVAGGKR